jgi:hypothetical protein
MILILPQISADCLSTNHNQTLVRSTVEGIQLQHNQTLVRSMVNGREINHNQTLVSR